jgi:hypothetical protein
MHGPEGHIRAQFDAHNAVAHFKLFDHTVELPWWLAAPTYPILIGVRIAIFMGAIPVAALLNLRKWKSDPEQSAIRAVAAERFVLVLRTFGHDGEFLTTSRFVPHGHLVPEVRTLESIVGDVAARLNLGSAVGFHDAHSHSIPRGVRFFEVANSTWESDFESLFPRASAIVIMPTPGVTIGDSLTRELDAIRQRGLTNKVVVMAPPDNDRTTRQATYRIYERLGWPLPRAVHLAAYMGDDGRLQLHPSIGKYDYQLDARYELAIDRALRTVSVARLN